MKCHVFLLLAFSACSLSLPVIEDKEYYDTPSFSYKYEVSDQKTGDHKSHHESRDGDIVKGYYSMMEADGTLREVHYTADKINGFKAVVTNSGRPQPQIPHKQPTQDLAPLPPPLTKARTNKNLFKYSAHNHNRQPEY